MLKRFLTGITLFVVVVSSYSQSRIEAVSSVQTQKLTIQNKQNKRLVQQFILNKIVPKIKKENPKLIALALTATLGPFGAHRIYLGTDPKVPIFYTITLGGGLGVLPAIDFIAILLTKDISVYYDNNKIFMWAD